MKIIRYRRRRKWLERLKNIRERKRERKREAYRMCIAISAYYLQPNTLKGDDVC